MFPHTVVALDTRVRKHLRHLAACGEALFWKAAALFLKWFLFVVCRGPDSGPLPRL